jgi:hypothetical protein
MADRVLSAEPCHPGRRLTPRGRVLFDGLGAVLVLLLAAVAQATPRMSLTAGTPCGACHVNPSGGEMRTSLGWSSMRDVAAFDRAALGLEHDGATTNAFFGDIVRVGGDFRVLGARLGRPEVVDTADGAQTRYPDVTWFPMQLQPYLAITPVDDLTLYGSWVVGPETFRAGEICDPVFPGMGCYSAFAMYEPHGVGVTARAGVFQPGIGVRHDDHTILVRGDAADRRTPIIPPSYAEPGGEIVWHPRQWVRGEFGLFAPLNLGESLNGVAQTADLWPVAGAARLTFQPILEFGGDAEDEAGGEDEFADFDGPSLSPPVAVNTWAGASAYGSGDFLMLNGFMGAGVHGGLALLAEIGHTRRTTSRETFNGLIGVTYAVRDWFVLAARAERAQTDFTGERFVTTQYVGGVEIFPLPYVEIRPEYRYVRTDDYLFGQATLQIHAFY